ncbi:MAG: enoyl-[acyl-carrier-protein] reductase FabK, partial [Peptostreptococcus porci]|nr:enoyl-[acyl-carrier-protein] reductase FabK [Peptostreptococcus porci]
SLEDNNASVEELEKFGAGSLRLAVVDGDVDNGSVMAGQIAGLVKKRETCKEIIQDLVEHYRAVVESL